MMKPRVPNVGYHDAQDNNRLPEKCEDPFMSGCLGFPPAPKPKLNRSLYTTRSKPTARGTSGRHLEKLPLPLETPRALRVFGLQENPSARLSFVCTEEAHDLEGVCWQSTASARLYLASRAVGTQPVCLHGGNGIMGDGVGGGYQKVCSLLSGHCTRVSISGGSDTSTSRLTRRRQNRESSCAHPAPPPQHPVTTLVLQHGGTLEPAKLPLPPVREKQSARLWPLSRQIPWPLRRRLVRSPASHRRFAGQTACLNLMRWFRVSLCAPMKPDALSQKTPITSANESRSLGASPTPHPPSLSKPYNIWHQALSLAVRAQALGERRSSSSRTADPRGC